MSFISSEQAKRAKNKVLKKDKWATPWSLFNDIDNISNFTLDVCALPESAKCSKFFTPVDNALMQSWAGHTCWMNPPYSETEIWLQKAKQESEKHNIIVVCLIPVSTSPKWWHRLVVDVAEIIWIPGRVQFIGAPHKAPFSSCLVVYDSKNVTEV